jgi:hypothetical protein
VKQLFNIKSERSSDTAQQVLSIRLGEKHGSFAITNRSGDELFLLTYCTTDQWNENDLAEFFNSQPELSNSFFQVLVCYDFPQNVLVPQKEYKQEDAGLLLKTLHGINGTETIISETIPEWQLYNIYAVPKEIQEWMTRKFPSSKYWHQHSLAIKNIDAANSNGSLGVDFRKDEFVLLSAREGKLLLAQTFSYSTPDDVVYYLLKVCQQFSLSQQEVQINLSGLIDKQSALYKEIYQYFINVQFREAAWNIPGDEYPAHFFTSLNDLARCAS